MHFYWKLPILTVLQRSNRSRLRSDLLDAQSKDQHLGPESTTRKGHEVTTCADQIGAYLYYIIHTYMYTTIIIFILKLYSFYQFITMCILFLVLNCHHNHTDVLLALLDDIWIS